MEYRRFSARTVEDAITLATVDLGIPSDQLDYVVEQEGSSGFFGLGSKEAIIKARVKEEEPEEAVFEEEIKEIVVEAAGTEAPKANGPKIKTLDEIEAKVKALQEEAEKKGVSYIEERPEKEPRRDRDRDSRRRGKKNDRRGGRSDRDNRPSRDDRVKANKAELDEETFADTEEHKPSEPKPEKAVPVRTEEEIATMIRDAETFLNSVFGAMDMEVEKNISYDAVTGSLSCEFEGDEMGILIGKRGQTLDSLQYLTSLVVNRNQKEYVRIKLDTEEYRKRRKETLETLSRNIAGKVKRTRRSVVLEPMNPYERRIIHSALQNNRYVETYSEGEEPFRRVVVAPKKNNY